MALNENTITSLSYIATFFRDIENLNDFLAHYNNALTELRTRYENITPEELPKRMLEEEKNSLSAIIQSIRFWSIRTFVKISALKERLKINQTLYNEIKKNSDTIKNKAVPPYENVENFVIAINSVFVEGVASELLKSVQDYYNQIGGGNFAGNNN